MSGATNLPPTRQMCTNFWENKITTPNITKNSQPCEFFLLYFQTILAVTVQDTNRYMQQDAQERNIPDIPHSQYLSAKDLQTFLSVIAQIDHEHKPSMKLCWMKDKFYPVPFYSGVMLPDFLMDVKYLYSVDIQKPPTQERAHPNYDRLWKITPVFDILNSNFSELLSSNRTYDSG
jgi:hypothetical protein